MASVLAPLAFQAFHHRQQRHRRNLSAFPIQRVRSAQRCAIVAAAADQQADAPAGQSSPVLLSSIFSGYNAISILEIPRDSQSQYAGARLLLLDRTGNVHSIYMEHSKWVGPYWDELSSLPPIIPEGPIALLGLGAGTAARLLLHLWPERKIMGWEIDQILIDKARMYLGLSELEGVNEQGGGLQVYIDDALSTDHDPEGGFAGIIVDLFSNGEDLSVLKEPGTWFKLKQRLRPGGRIMINCTTGWNDIFSAMSQAFPGEVNCRILEATADNRMAFTGPLPDLDKWSQAVPERLQGGVLEWKPFHTAKAT